jgi:nucleotide-binding universal stress UspA family protein
MYKTILVPLDGSSRAEAILDHVENLAMRYGAGVILFRVVEKDYFVPQAETVIDVSAYREEYQRRETETVAYLENVKKTLAAKGIPTEIRISHDPVVRAILDVADRENADLIAMASHGRSGLARVFYGSVAAGVLHRVDRPLLIIRSQHEG